MRILCYISILVSIGWVTGCQKNAEPETPVQSVMLAAPELLPLSQAQFGIDVNSLKVIQDNFEPQQFLRDVLIAHGVDQATIAQLAIKSEDVFSVRQMRAGHAYTILKDPDDASVKFFIYEKNKAEYVVFDLREGVKISEGQRRVRTEQRQVSAEITSSLYETLEAAALDPQLGQELEAVFGWAVDFTHLEKGDYFRAIYHEHFVDGESLSLGRLQAAEFFHAGKSHYAFYFEQDSLSGYFDQHGQSLLKPFLLAPAKPTEEASTVRREAQANLSRGTRYFAPVGTPVIALGDGVIETMRYKSQTGHYLTIRHNSQYTSQYLHLQNLPDALSTGMFVEQGQVIGEVGRSGSSRNPYVTARFFSRGKAIPRSQVENPEARSVLPANEADFSRFKHEMMGRLSQISLGSQGEAIVWR
jgi:murein DD-endopeptidase MepM/ murein hydrolase activator NlpD